MSKKPVSSTKKLYEKELKTLDGEMIVFLENNAFKIKQDGFSEDFFDKFWIEEKTRLLFKPQSMITSTFAEILTSHLYNKLGLKTIEVYPAISVKANSKHDSKEGIVTPDFVKDRVRDKDVYAAYVLDDELKIKHSVEENMQSLPKYAQKIEDRFMGAYDVELDGNIEKDLEKLVLLDFVTNNSDRHKKNLAYLLIKKDGKIHIKLSPIYDNGMSFGLTERRKSLLIECIKANDIEKFEKFINNFSSYNFTLFKNDYYFNGEERTPNEFVNQNLKTSLANAIIQKKHLKLLFNKVMKLKLEDIIEEIKLSIPQLKINRDDLLLAKAVFEIKKRELYNEILKVQAQDNNKNIAQKEVYHGDQFIF